jgi:Origin recognition complex winged helix C-terminal/Origin recognition complex (ORC) subunit 3 N-terminus
MSNARGTKRMPSAFAPSGVTDAFRRVHRASSTPNLTPVALASEKARLEAFAEARDSLRRALADARDDARAPALRAVAIAVRSPSANVATEVVAVTLIMGAGAAAGDRDDTFSTALDVAKVECERTSGGNHVSVARLSSASHSTFPAAMTAFDEACVDQAGAMRPKTVIVALEDSDCFPEETLRDLVYICGTRHADELLSSEGGQRIVILFGVSIPGDSVHAALGAREATMIAPRSVSMPSAEVCFHAVVEHVLDTTKHPIILTRSTFRMLRNEFLTSTTSVARLELTLLEIYCLHFSEKKLASVFARPDLVPCYLRSTSLPGRELLGPEFPEIGVGERRREEVIEKLMTDDLITLFMNSTEAKSTEKLLIDAMSDGDAVYWASLNNLSKLNPAKYTPVKVDKLVHRRKRANACHYASRFFDKLCEWRALSSIVQFAVWRLVVALDVSPSDLHCDENEESNHLEWFKTGNSVSARQHLRTLLFEEFLPDSSPEIVRLADLRSKKLLSLVRKKIERLGLPHIRRCVEQWTAELKHAIESAKGCPAIETLGSLVAKLEALADKIRDALNTLPERTEQGAEVADTGVSAGEERMQSDDEGSVAQSPAVKACKANTFDSAFDGVKDGTVRSGRGQRARGGAAAKARRNDALLVAKKAIEVTTPVSEARRETLALFSEMLELVRPLQDLAMHEVMLFDNQEGLKLFSGGMGSLAEPRASLFKTLRHPDCGDAGLALYLRGQQVDVAAAYQILAEGGRMVNLSDWYHSFGSVRLSSIAPPPPIQINGIEKTDFIDAQGHRVGNSEVNETDSVPDVGEKIGLTTAATTAIGEKDGDEIALGRSSTRSSGAPSPSPAQVALPRTELVTQAEFARAVPTFEFLGIIKHTNRKADHVQRLEFE